MERRQIQIQLNSDLRSAASRPAVSFKDLSSKSLLGIMDKFVWTHVIPQEQSKSSQAVIDLFGDPFMLKDMDMAGEILEKRQKECGFDATGIMPEYLGMYRRVWEQIFRQIFSQSVYNSMNECVTANVLSLTGPEGGPHIYLDCNNFLRAALISLHGSIIDGIFDEYFQNTCCLVDSVVGWSSTTSVVHMELTNTPEVIVEQMKESGLHINQGNFVYPEAIHRYTRVFNMLMEKLSVLRPDINMMFINTDYEQIKQAELAELCTNNQITRDGNKIIGFVFPHELFKESITNFGIGASVEEKDQSLVLSMCSYFVAMITLYGIVAIDSVVCVVMPSLVERLDTTDFFFICTVKVNPDFGIPIAVDTFSAQEDTCLLYRALLVKGLDTIHSLNCSVFDPRATLCIHEVVGLDRQSVCSWCQKPNKAATSRLQCVERASGSVSLQSNLVELENEGEVVSAVAGSRFEQEQKIQDMEVMDMERRLNQLLDDSQVDVFMDEEEARISDVRFSVPLEKVLQLLNHGKIDNRTAEMQLASVLQTYKTIAENKSSKILQIQNEIARLSYQEQHTPQLEAVILDHQSYAQRLTQTLCVIQNLSETAKFHADRLSGKIPPRRIKPKNAGS